MRDLQQGYAEASSTVRAATPTTVATACSAPIHGKIPTIPQVQRDLTGTTEV